jgi:hypothetical protein
MPEYKDEKGYTIDEQGNKSAQMTLTPTIYVGDVTFDNGEKAQILTTWGQSTIVRFDDGSEVIWNWKEIINEAVKIKDARKKPTSAATEISK